MEFDDKLSASQPTHGKNSSVRIEIDEGVVLHACFRVQNSFSQI
jgi:hypothetical protein